MLKHYTGIHVRAKLTDYRVDDPVEGQKRYPCYAEIDVVMLENNRTITSHQVYVKKDGVNYPVKSDTTNVSTAVNAVKAAAQHHLGAETAGEAFIIRMAVEQGFFTEADLGLELIGKGKYIEYASLHRKPTLFNTNQEIQNVVQ